MKAFFLVFGAAGLIALSIYGQIRVTEDCGWQAMFTKDITTYWLLGGCKGEH